MKSIGRNSPVQKVQLAGRVEKPVDFSLIISVLNGPKEGKLGASLVSYLGHIPPMWLKFLKHPFQSWPCCAQQNCLC